MTAKQMTYKAPLQGRVLICEDEPLIGQAIQKDLQKKNFGADWFGSYEECMNAMKENTYHAVIADIFFENHQSRGLDIVHHARENGIPSVLMTSSLDVDVARDGLNYGADYLLEKPFESDRLIKILLDIWENPKGLISRRERAFDQASLTNRERVIGRLILKGLTNQELADVIGTTIGTVKFYSSQIFEKFGVQNRAELFNYIFPT